MLQDANKELPPERYDAKLFQQAYRAGLKAKELDKEKAKKVKRNKYFIYSLSIPLLISLFYLFKPEPKERYLSTLPISSYDETNIFYPEVVESEVKGTYDFNISAKSAIAYDANTLDVYYSKNIHEQLPIASLTKLVTSMVMIDLYGLDSDIEVTKDIPEELGWSLGIEKGDVINTSELIKAMLISSYNDAAYVIANEYGYEEFISKMNQKASLLGCLNTNFENPAGLDSDSHYSTVSDFQKILSAVLKYPSILNITDMLGDKVTWISSGEIETEYIYTTNQLLGNNFGVKGLKTGYTESSGQCLVTLYEANDKDYVIIILGSEDRFGETEKILRYLE